MGKIAKQLHEEVIDSVPDRWAEFLEIKDCDHNTVNLVHINFRNMQFKLTHEEFREWQEGFKVAMTKLGDRLDNDI